MYCTARITPAGTQWEFNNGDAVSSVGDDEADAQDRRRNRALLKTMRMPGRTRQAHRAARYSCRSKSCLEESIYRPVSVKLSLSGPNGFAAKYRYPRAGQSVLYASTTALLASTGTEFSARRQAMA